MIGTTDILALFSFICIKEASRIKPTIFTILEDRRERKREGGICE